MGAYLVRRLVTMPVVLFVMVTLSFFIMRLAPGNPFADERKLPPEIHEALNKKYGFDAHPVVQYGRYIGRAVQGDLGPSTKFKDRTVNEILADHIGPTVVIGIGAIVLSLGIGLIAGVIGAVRQNSTLDYASMSLAMFGMSVPRFVTGPVLVLIFALHWKWLPVSGYVVEFTTWPWALSALVALYVAWRFADWKTHGMPFSGNFDRVRRSPPSGSGRWSSPRAS